MAPPLTPPQSDRRPPEQRDPVESALHDLANVLASARSYAEIVLLRTRAGGSKDPALAESLLRELERATDLLRSVRRETYRAGDVLACTSCGYTFVFRKTSGTRASCRRCNGTEVTRWRPDGQ